MLARPLEASRRIPIPPQEEQLPEKGQLPFAFVFAVPRIATPRPEHVDEDPTYSNPYTSGTDSNNPGNDEEIDWLADD